MTPADASARLRAIADTGRLSIRDQAALKQAAALLDQMSDAIGSESLRATQDRVDCIRARATVSVLRVWPRMRWR